MDVRGTYMWRIRAALVPKVEGPNAGRACEEAMILCLVTAAIAHRRIGFHAETVETVSSKLLERLDELLAQ